MGEFVDQCCENCRIKRIVEKGYMVRGLVLPGISTKLLIFVLVLLQSSIGNVLSQVIHSVTVPPLEAVRIGSNARIVCRFHGTNFKIQYISWTKVFIGGGKAHVYGYDKCSGENNGFYDLENRSILDVANPSALRHTRSVSPEVTTEHPINTLNWDKDRFPAIYNIQDAPRTVLSYDGRSVRTIESYGDGIQISPDDHILTGSATLTIKEVKLEDEARYECLVKPVNGPAETDIQLLTVVVLPTTPRITTPALLVENRNYTFLCRAFVGRPTGAVQWFIKRVGGAFKMMPDQMVETQLTHYSNGTSSAESRLLLNVTENIHSAILRCEVSSRAMRPWERRPFHQQRLNVLYPPRKGRILYDSRTRRYYCDAEGNPKPTYIWMWVLGEGTKTILSTSPFLDLSPIQSTGIFQFQCLASNMIETQRHTIVMKTKIKIQGTTTKTTTTTTSSPRQYLENLQHNESKAYSNWSMGYGEPYNFEKAKPRQHFDIRGEPVPVWDIIHGYVGHDQNPVSSKSYNISVISQTLGNKEDIKSMRQVKVKNSASSYIQPGNSASLLNDIDTNKTVTPKEKIGQNDESTTVSSYSTATPTMPEEREIITTSGTTSSLGERKIKLSESEISEMSPENYDYGDNTEDSKDKEKKKENWENTDRENTIKTVEPQKSKPKVVTTNKNSPVQTFNRKETVNEPQEDATLVNETMPLLPVITVSELLSGRYKKTRPAAEERTANTIVTYNKNGKPDYSKILRRLPTAQKRYIRRRIGNINRKFNQFFAKYTKQFHGIEGKQGFLKDNIYLNTKQDQSELSNTDLYDMYDDPPFKDNEAYESNYYANVDNNYNSVDAKSQTEVIDYGFENEKSQLQLSDNDRYHRISSHHSLRPTVSQTQNHQNTNQFGILLPEEDNAHPPAPEIVIPNIPFDLVSPTISNPNAMHDLNKYSRTYASDTGESGNFKNAFMDYYNQNAMMVQSVPSQNDQMQEIKDAFLSDQHRTDIRNVDSVMNDFPSLLPTSHRQLIQDSYSKSERAMDLHSVRHNINNNQRMQSQPERPSYTPYRADAIGSNIYPSAEPYDDVPGHTEQLPPLILEARHPGIHHQQPQDWDRRHGQSFLSRLLPEAKESPDYSDDSKYTDEFEKVYKIANGEFDCKDRQNGPHGGGCRAFYRCMDGVAYKVECRPPYVFNEGTGHCDDASKTSSACGDWKDCRSKPNGKYADTTRNCKFYFTCYQGMFLGHNECNPGTVFNEKEQVCDWPNNAPQPCGNG